MALTAYSRRPMTSWRVPPSSPARHLDLTLVGSVTAVALLGALMIFTATRVVCTRRMTCRS